jgi:hypothetical protein
MGASWWLWICRQDKFSYYPFMWSRFISSSCVQWGYNSLEFRQCVGISYHLNLGRSYTLGFWVLCSCQNENLGQLDFINAPYESQLWSSSSLTIPQIPCFLLTFGLRGFLYLLSQYYEHVQNEHYMTFYFVFLISRGWLRVSGVPYCLNWYSSLITRASNRP